MKKLLIILTCFVIYSCQNQAMDAYHTLNDELGMVYQMEIEPPRTAEPPPPPSEYSLDKGSKIIKTGSMSFEVTKLEASKKRINTVLKSANGYFEDEVYRSYGNRLTYNLKVRIPNAKFDSLINVLEDGIGELISKNINAKDVTEEYIDLNIRLGNNLAYLEQYQAILQKAKSIKEILEVQEKIRQIEEEIESRKGRLKYLDDNVKYSTLNLEISELTANELSNKPNFGHRIINAFNNGIQGILNVVVALVNLWPLLILLLIVILSRKKIWNWIRRKN